MSKNNILKPIEQPPLMVVENGSSLSTILRDIECPKVITENQFRRLLIKAYTLVKQSNHSDLRAKFDAVTMSVVSENITDIASELGYPLWTKEDKLYFFNGEYWQHIECDDLTSLINKLTLALRGDNYKSKINDYDYQKSLIRQLNTHTFFKERYNEGEKPNLINFKNQTVEISTSGVKTKDFNKDDYLIYKLNYDYDPQAKYPLFQKFLDESLPKDSQRIISEFVGLSLLPALSRDAQNIEKVCIFFGSGGNGKSVCLEVIKALFCDNITSTVDLTTACEKGRENTRLQLIGKRLNLSTDTDLKQIISKGNTATLKALISREPVSYRKLYSNEGTTTDLPLHMVSVNDLPNSNKDQSRGFYRRLLIIPFLTEVHQDNMDKDLAYKIINGYTDSNGVKHEPELSGIMNWAIEGLTRYIKSSKKFTKSEQSERALSKYKTESNDALYFVNEVGYIGCKHDTKGCLMISRKELWEEYKTKCLMEGEDPLTQRVFTKLLKEGGWEPFQKIMTKNRYWCYTLKSEVDSFTNEKLPF